MKGKLIQINISQGGIPKKPVPQAFVSYDRVDNDQWNYHDHGGRQRAVCLFSLELIKELNKEGYSLYPGALGENFTTEGLDYREIRIGDKFQVGKEVQIQINRIRVPCSKIDMYGESLQSRIYDEDVKQGKFESPKWGVSGYKCEVLKEGFIYPGDEMILL